VGTLTTCCIEYKGAFKGKRAMETKECTKCSQIKDVVLFNKRMKSLDGYMPKCQSCEKEYKNTDKYKESNRIRCKEDYKKNTTIRKAAVHTYKQTERGKEGESKQRKKYRAEYPLKYKAHGIVTRAILSGKLLKQNCEACGSTNGVEAHHEDYNKPLDVNWLCVPHHIARHKEINDNVIS
jgi:hypothetical protein